MDDQTQDDKSSSSNPVDHGAAAEPVRSRWTPKPEQILILESIFNSGMVNPAKEETVRIRKLLEKFGAVGDANVFYWFQNRRSRSRRRQRQLQAAGLAADPAGACKVGGSSAVSREPTNSSSTTSSSSSRSPNNSAGGGVFAASSSSYPSFVGDHRRVDDFFSNIDSHNMGYMKSAQNPFECASDHAPQLQYHPGTITVFINGVPSEVPSLPFDLRAMFGQNVMLVHASGELVPVNEYGILMHSLQMGESYFLVSSPT